MAGSSDHCAPLPRIQNTPCNTARVSCQGRPRLSSRRTGRSNGSTNSHCSSVNSQRPAMLVRRDALSNFSLAEIRPRNVYEMGSRIRLRIVTDFESPESTAQNIRGGHGWDSTEITLRPFDVGISIGMDPTDQEKEEGYLAACELLVPIAGEWKEKK